jgi:hypothetical protein
VGFLSGEKSMLTDLGSTRRDGGISLRVDEVVIDCGNPCLLATFWARVLGYEVFECDEDIASIEDPTDIGPGICFQRVAEAKSAKNRVHLDLRVASGDLDATVAHLISLGASKVEVGQGVHSWWVVLADPEGNEFCLVA